MAMAIISSRTRLGRRLFLGSPFVLAAGSALAQSAEIKFKHSSLVIATGAREIKFDVELALNDATSSGPMTACCSTSTRTRPSASG